MFKGIIKSGVWAFAGIAFFAAYSQASPTADDVITLDFGTYHKGDGGEFLLKSTENAASDYAFTTFCLEKNEFFTPYSWSETTTYIIESVGDSAKDGGNGFTTDGFSSSTEDYISNTTKWLMNQYIFKYSSIWDGSNKNDFAGLMQNTVWYLEDEIDYDELGEVADYSLLTYYETNKGQVDKTYSADILTNIKVVNIFDENGVYKQSQLIANPVPEPATMLLFGSGLVGLAAIGRKKIRK